jgi:hypothetical protein
VVDDATSEEAQNVVRFRHAAFVASFVRSDDDSERSLSVLNRLERVVDEGAKRVPALLTVHSSTYLPFVAERVLARSLPVHVLYPEHLEGLNAANVLYAYYRGFIAAYTRQPRILICGRGRRVFHLIDCFLKNLSQSECEKLIKEQDEKVSSGSTAAPLAIMTNDEVLVKQLASSPHGSKRDTTQREPGANAAGARPSDVEPPRVLRFRKFTSRRPDNPQAREELDQEIGVPVIEFDAVDYASARTAIEKQSPDALLFSDHTAEDEFLRMNAVLSAVGATIQDACSVNGANAEPPRVFVSGETGRRHLGEYFGRYMRFYAARWHSNSATMSESSWFPTQGITRSAATDPYRGASLIDVLDDPTERAVGIVRAYLEAVPNGVSSNGDLKPEQAVELNFCHADTSGVLGGTLARLAGLKINETDSSAVETEARIRLRLSIANARLIAREDGRFILRTYARLRTPSQSLPPAFSRLSVFGEHDVIGTVRDLCMSDGLPAREESAQAHHHTATQLLSEVGAKNGASLSHDLNHQTFKALVHDDEFWKNAQAQLGKALSRVREVVNSDIRRSVSDCCGMPTCPVECVHKIAEVTADAPIWRDKDTPEKQFKASSWRLWNAETWLQSRNLFRHYLADPTLTIADPDDAAPLAHIMMHCEAGRSTGAFAVAVNTLIMQGLHAMKAGSSKIHSVFDLTYVSLSECHDSRYGVFTCYGRQTTTVPDDAPALCKVIESILIWPISPADTRAWATYATDLCKFMNACAGLEAYTLYGPHERVDVRGAKFEIARTRTCP